MSRKKQPTGIEQVVVIAGSQQAVADFVKVSQQAVAAWVKQGYAPVRHLIALESEYGVSRHDLVRPLLRELLED